MLHPAMHGIQYLPTVTPKISWQVGKYTKYVVRYAEKSFQEVSSTMFFIHYFQVFHIFSGVILLDVRLGTPKN